MRRRTVVKFALVMGSLCLAAWRLPPMIEKVQAQASSTMGLSQLLTGGLAGGGLPLAAASEAPPPPEPVLFIGGKELTDAQKAELLEQARRADPLRNALATAPRGAGSAAPVRSPQPARTPLEQELDKLLGGQGLDQIVKELTRGE